MTVPYHTPLPHEYRTHLGVSLTCARPWNRFLFFELMGTALFVIWTDIFQVSQVNNSNINCSSGNDILTPAITALSTADTKAPWEFILLITVSDKLSCYCSVYCLWVHLGLQQNSEVNKPCSGFSVCVCIAIAIHVLHLLEIFIFVIIFILVHYNFFLFIQN